jgi:hypothetical protein
VPSSPSAKSESGPRPPPSPYGGSIDDVFTSADIKAHTVYLRSHKECFPNIPVVAEEGAATVGTGSRIFFTVDPLDGSPPPILRCWHRAKGQAPFMRSH